MDAPLLAGLLAGALALALMSWAWSVASLLRRLRLAHSAKQSQSTRYGQIAEQFAPWMASWPWDPKGFRFIGSPVDGVQFLEDGVVFVEIKSADGRLTAQQASIKGHVEAGRVTWREVRIR